MKEIAIDRKETDVTEPVPNEELQRRLDMMATQGIKTGPMLDRMVLMGTMTERQGNALKGIY
jgi:hypothetical protein